MFAFRKILFALFSWNTRFEIRPFALLPTCCSYVTLNIFSVIFSKFFCYSCLQLWVKYLTARKDRTKNHESSSNLAIATTGQYLSTIQWINPFKVNNKDITKTILSLTLDKYHLLLWFPHAYFERIFQNFVQNQFDDNKGEIFCLLIFEQILHIALVPSSLNLDIFIFAGMKIIWILKLVPSTLHYLVPGGYLLYFLLCTWSVKIFLYKLLYKQYIYRERDR